MHSSTLITFATALLAAGPSVNALGINCRGSGLCHLATWENKAPASIMQVLRNAVWESDKDNSTTYTTGEHIICVSEKQPINLTGTATYNTPESEGGSGSLAGSFGLSGSIATGGICLFPQMPGGTLSLGTIRPLTDKLLEHGCGTCGSIPIDFLEGSNDPKNGILTFNYVKSPYCVGDCISAVGSTSNNATAKRTIGNSAKFAALKE